MAEPIKITVSGILEDLKNGYTRTTGEKHYLGDGKSIQEKYGLNKSQVTELFTHEKLKGKKTITIKAPAFILEDDTEDLVELKPDPINPESNGQGSATDITPSEDQITAGEDPSWMDN